jgi:hypothetical protein
MTEPTQRAEQYPEPGFVESEVLTTDQEEQPETEPEPSTVSSESALTPTPLPETPLPSEELSPEAEQAVYDKLALRQAKRN